MSPSPPRRDSAPLASHTSLSQLVHATRAQPGAGSAVECVGCRLSSPPHAPSQPPLAASNEAAVLRGLACASTVAAST